MAVKRAKDVKPEASIPTALQAMLTKAFSFQAIRDSYDAVFKTAKGEVVEYLETTDEMSVEMGKGFRCAEGMVTMKQTTTWKFDNDKILALIESGHVSIATIVSMASFKEKDLRAALGDREFSTLASSNVTESLALTGSSDFKASVAEKFATYLPAEPAAKEESAPAVKKPKAKVGPEPVRKSHAENYAELDSRERARVAAEIARRGHTAPDDDLDAILKS